MKLIKISYSYINPSQITHITETHNSWHIHVTGEGTAREEPVIVIEKKSDDEKALFKFIDSCEMYQADDK